MLEEEQRQIILQGVKTWNRWRSENPAIKPSLVGVNLSEMNLKEVNLSDTNLRETNLSRANLTEANLVAVDAREANLVGADLSGANLMKSKLSLAKFGRANLTGASLNRANLSGAIMSLADLSWSTLSWANLSWANLSGANLSHCNLSRANLSGIDLSWANLNWANLSEANLKEAILVTTQALNTNFSHAILTGACIKDWKINLEANLDNINCQYIFLEWEHQERRPLDTNDYFRPGDFARFLTKKTETLELVFTNGIDWEIFLESWRKIENEVNHYDVELQRIEKKSNESLIIGLAVSKDLDKTVLESSFWEHYRTLLKMQDTNNELRKSQILLQRLENTKILNIIQAIAQNNRKK